jgi:uncharacterized membrane protein YjjB (DUF3815 family)
MHPLANPIFHLSAVLGALCFAIVFRTPKRYLPHTTFIGYLSLVGLNAFPKTWHLGLVTFFTALAIGSVSHIFARFTRAPAQCFLIPGVILLVPGTYVYRSFSAALADRLQDAANLALVAVTITFSISIGILLANWLAPSRRTL